MESVGANQLLDLQNFHVFVAPLSEVVSIKIEKNQNHDAHHKIYGIIQIKDGEGNTFDFYNRDDDNPETIPRGGTLTLTVLKDRIIVASNHVKVDINLKDGDNNEEIVKGVFDWNCMTKAGYHEISVVEFQGKCGSAVLQYASFFHAVVARVDILLQRRKGDPVCGTSVKVYGEIISHYGTNFSSNLFNKKRGEAVIIDYGSYIELSRNVFIVPALKSLDICAKLFERETRRQIVEDKIEFNPFRYSTLQDILEGQSGKLIVRFKMTHPYMQLPRERIPRAHHFREQQSSINRRSLLLPFGMKLFEFYTFSIGGVNNEDVNLWGSIKILFDDRHNYVFLFRKDKSSSHGLVPYQTVPMTSYSDRLAMLAICVDIKLGDANDCLVSSGYMSWEDFHFETYKSLFNRQLCSIIRGTDGYYATIHYSIFDSGVQAVVSIFLHKKSSAMKYVKVGGSICTEYSGFDYSILYNKEYYRRRLFSRKSTESWTHCPDSSIMLSQSSVMVPYGSALTLDVNLEVTPKEATLEDEVNTTDCVSQVGDAFNEPLEFKVDMGFLTDVETVTKEIQRPFYRIVVGVEWRSVL